MSSNSLQYLRQEVAHLQDENQQLKEELASLRHYTRAIHHLMEAVDAIDTRREIILLMRKILYDALTVLDAKDGSLLVLDEDTDELVFVLAIGDVDEEALVGYRLPKGAGIAGWVVTNAKPTIVNQVSSDPRFLPSVDQVFDFQTDSILAVPLIGSGRVLGVVEVLNKHSGEDFTQTDLMLLNLLCRFAGEALLQMVESDAEDSEKVRK